MMLIGWMDYKTTDFAMTVFYFGPVVLATWRAGRKAGWFIAVLCGVTGTRRRLDGTSQRPCACGFLH